MRGLVYPVPDPELPFLGVHLTRGIDGRVHAGPNAVLALAREGYGWGRVDARDLADTLGYAGFWRLARRQARSGVGEMARSLSHQRFAESVRRLVPEVADADLVPAPAGVRAQAVRPDGTPRRRLPPRAARPASCTCSTHRHRPRRPPWRSPATSSTACGPRPQGPPGPGLRPGRRRP